MTARVPVFACGDPSRGDDAAAMAAVELLPAAVLDRAAIEVVGALDVQHLLDLPPGAPCVVVDAVAGIAAGEVWVRPLAALGPRGAAQAGGAPGGRGAALPVGAAATRRPEPRSSHQLALGDVLALAATLRGEPAGGTFVGIGGTRWDLGAPLDAAVAAALPAFAAAIAAAIDALYFG